MRITILAIGSRGDIWPYLALGLGLQRAGHRVTLATHQEFETSVRELGLVFTRVSGNPREMVESAAGQRWLESGNNPLEFLLRSAAAVKLLTEAAVPDMMKACLNAEAVIFSPLSSPASHFAERLGVPCLGGHPAPLGATRERPHMLVPVVRTLGGPLNLLTHFVLDQLSWQLMRSQLNHWRRDTLDLPPVPFLGPSYRRDHEIPMLFSFSPGVSPRPSDWPSHYHVTGYWFLDTSADWEPPSELVDFLAAGPPPVYVGFGSMATRDAGRMTQLVLAALRRAGKRGLLLAGWGDLGRGAASDDVFVMESAPHEWLFPQVAAVVHHGGAGTTAAGLRAGVPAVLTPFFADQFYWARRVRDLGAGPAPIPHRQLTAENLAAAIRVATEDKSIRARAAEVGVQLRAEDGVANAVAVVEQYVESWTGAPAALSI